MRASGFEIVSLDEAHFRLIEGDYGKPFVCFTFDDGYRDNLEYAYPIFKRHTCLSPSTCRPTMPTAAATCGG